MNQTPLNVTFIDWEYCGFNFAAFDVANHFLEFTGVEEELDYTNSYPCLPYQQAWVSAYLSEYHSLMGREAPKADECEKFLMSVNSCLACSHLLWAIWAQVQAKISSHEFDFRGVATQRMREYKKTKKYLKLTNNSVDGMDL